jgi:hypothetical protein
VGDVIRRIAVLMAILLVAGSCSSGGSGGSTTTSSGGNDEADLSEVSPPSADPGAADRAPSGTLKPRGPTPLGVRPE